MDAGSAPAYICVTGGKTDFAGLMNDFPEWNSCISQRLNVVIVKTALALANKHR